jgi:hypothetical protein
MPNLSFTKRLIILAVLLVVFLLPAAPVRADIAPPKPPPGANILPGEEFTQVRMLAETVVFEVQSPAAGVEPLDDNVAIVAQARVSATFTMRNLGSQAESMAVRFPLNYWVFNYADNMPDIGDLQVKVDGSPVSTRHIQSTEPADTKSTTFDWSEFDVTFPPGQDVAIEASYTSIASGFSNQGGEQTMVFQYILETGAGWNDTIGSADIIMRFPFAVSAENVLDEGAGYGSPTPNFTFNGNEIRWHYDNLEPTQHDNILIPLVRLAAWQEVVDARQAVQDNPSDGEAWGRLGMRIKAVLLSHHTLRMDPGVDSLYSEARQAYERCLELLPKDGLWHFGYADLLWQHYNTQRLMPAGVDPAEAELAVRELQLSMQLAPNNERAYELMCWMYYEPGYLTGCGDTCSFDCPFDQLVFLALTATPVPPTPWLPPDTLVPPVEQPSATSVPPTKQPSATPVQPTLTAEAPAATSTSAAPVPATQAALNPTSPPAPTTTNPLCPGNLGAPLALVGAVGWLKRKQRITASSNK